MKNLLNPLKKILTSLTGEETEDKNIVAVVDKIADAVEDNASINGGGASYFDFEFYYDAETFNVDSCTATFEEIKTAIDNGQIPRSQFTGYYGSLLFEDDYNLMFLQFVPYQKTLSILVILITVNNTFTTDVWNVTHL